MFAGGFDSPKPGGPHDEGDPIGDSTTPNPTDAIGGIQPTPASAPPVSKFDPKRYRQSQAMRVEEAGDWGRKQQTIIPVRKPGKKIWVHAHPSPDFRADCMPTVEDETTGEIYLLSSDLPLPPNIENKVDQLNLTTAITVDGSLFLWFYKNSTNSWSDSARIAIQAATRSWIRTIPDKSSNGYLLEYPMIAPPDPMWPPLTFTQILETAFGSRFIDSLNHPMIKKLRGDFNV